MKILLITEQREGQWNKVSFETLAAAQQIVQQTQGTLAAAVVGKGVAPLAEELAGYELDEVLLIEHALLEKYTPDGFSLALRQAIEGAKPDLVLLPHTYQVRDFAPKLAASLERGMIGDCIGFRRENEKLIFVRPIFQGRMAADVVFEGHPPWFASFQAGAFRADLTRKRASGRGPVKSVGVELKPEQIRTKPLEIFREARQTADLTQAPILVSVGRGIKGPENIPMIEKLARLVGGEICASRPVCDEGWLPMDKLIGSSGETVAPKLYLAIGISGAIQHVVGMKGSRTIAAINQDPRAPIFEIADYGVVGDLFEIVPALIAELEK
ncbi:MAG: electron transfer flavoprotein subunit alpha/FixB family protein [Candidatus Acidiferrales bacterium]